MRDAGGFQFALGFEDLAAGGHAGAEAFEFGLVLLLGQLRGLGGEGVDP